MIQLFRFCTGKITTAFPKLSFKVKDFQTFKAEKNLALKSEDVRTLMKMHQLSATWKIVKFKITPIVGRLGIIQGDQILQF